MFDKNLLHDGIEQLKNQLAILWRFIYPPFCPACKTFDVSNYGTLCKHCDGKILPIVSTTIELTPSKSMKVFAVSAYQDPLKKMILAKKYRNIAMCRALAHIIWHKTDLSYHNFDYIVPVPLHWTRYAWRGYNQAEEIALVLAKLAKIPIKKDLIKRAKRTYYQSSLSKESRQKNVQDAFYVNQSNPLEYVGKHLLILDDLLTTGATLKSMGRELLKLKPAQISVVVVCRVP